MGDSKEPRNTLEAITRRPAIPRKTPITAPYMPERGSPGFVMFVP